MKKCSRCKQEKPLEEFNFKNKSLQIRQKSCKQCTRLQIRRHYYKNREYYLNKSLVRNKKNREVARQYIMEHLSLNPCVDCGEKDPRVLEFDHIGNKTINISTIIKDSRGIETLEKEIAKCEVRCANCHRKKTAKDFNWYKHNSPL